jgi:hypothetical protein
VNQSDHDYGACSIGYGAIVAHCRSYDDATHQEDKDEFEQCELRARTARKQANSQQKDEVP